MTESQIRAIEERAACVEMDKNHCYWVTPPGGKRSRYKGVTGALKTIWSENLENWKIDKQTDACELAGWSVYNSTLGLDLAGWKESFRKSLGEKYGGAIIADEAAEVGKGLHALIECQQKRFLGIPAPVPAIPDNLRARVDLAYRNWAPLVVKADLKPIAMEFRVFSEKHKFAGTVDWLGAYRGKLAVLDWKPKRPYPKHYLQLSAYANALREGGIEVEAAIICINREREAEPLEVPVNNMAEHFEAFLWSLGLSRWLGKMDPSRRSRKEDVA